MAATVICPPGRVSSPRSKEAMTAAQSVPGWTRMAEVRVRESSSW
jgi:hypothetical protein